ncbi:MAG: short-chain dehydrogenase [Sulfobacillus acidophilus]|uniref:Short-chain dehydrogenase n=1 Tax=Sulfobacillus acidophilus TaxID=53633 RepID=A0A2T2WGJ0_9FIRM|nr:MAG: short-chain dehydrogenase [Sulfobacillus acidophilus]
MSIEISLEGQVALITGGASGIGHAAALRLGQAGARVVVMDRKAEADECLSDFATHHVDGRYIEADVTSAADAQRAVRYTIEQYGRLDVLFNNAGIIRRRTVLTLDESDWDLVMAVNVKSIYLMSKEAIPAMVQTAGGGSIINTASGWGVVAGTDAVAYCASKAAVINMTRAMALDHGRQNIRVNSISPGDTDTAMLRGEAAELGQPWNSFRQSAASRPLARIGEPRDIADAVVFLASSLSAWVTGSNVVVDGGGLAGTI